MLDSIFGHKSAIWHRHLQFSCEATLSRKTRDHLVSTNTKSLAKEFSKILTFEYLGYLKIGFDVFFDADSESPRMT